MRCPPYVFAFLVACQGPDTMYVDNQGYPVPTELVEDGEKSGSRIEVRRTVTTYLLQDGGVYKMAPLYSTLFDTKLNTECAMRVAEDGKQRCLPSSGNAVPSGYFADDKCTAQVMLAPCASTPARYLVSAAPAACGAPLLYEVYQLVQLDVAAPRYAGNPGSCSPAGALPPGYLSYRLGGKLAPTEFVEARTTVATTVAPMP